MYTAEQASYVVGCSKANIYKHARTYSLGTIKYNRILFTDGDIEKLKERRGKVGRPRMEE